MAELDYKNLLKRVIESTPKKEITEDRFKIPKADVFYEGNTTVIRNFDKISDTINREADIVLKFLLGGLGTAGEIIGGNRAVFQGKIPTIFAAQGARYSSNNIVIFSPYSTISCMKRIGFFTYLSNTNIGV